MLILAGVMLWRWRNLDRARPLRIRRLWVVPAIYGALVIAMLAFMPPRALGWLCLLAGLAVGAGIGWHRGKLMRLHVDEDSGRVMMRQSPAALLLILAVAVARRLIHPATSVSAGTSGHLPAEALYFTDALLGFALGMIVAQRAEIWLRSRALMARHQKAPTPPADRA